MDQIAILCSRSDRGCRLIKSLGYDPLWFGVIKIVTRSRHDHAAGGLNCFVVARYFGAAGRRSISTACFRISWAHLIAIAILVIWPQIILCCRSRWVTDVKKHKRERNS